MSKYASLAVIAVPVPVVFALVTVLPPWYAAVVPRWFTRAAVLGFFWAMVVAQGVALVLAAAGVLTLGPVLVRARRRRARKPVAARLLLLSVTCLVGLAAAEAASSAWLAREHRYPALPTRLPGPGAGKGDLTILVIGESSARGDPYQDWLSIPAVVAWQLGRVFPGRRVSVDMRAAGGRTLEPMHRELAGLTYRPDAVFVYSGHNEFSGRFPWSRNAPHYRDAHPAALSERLERLARVARLTAIGRVALEGVEKQRLDIAPKHEVTRDLIDVPCFTPLEFEKVRDDYGGRLAAVVDYCGAIGAVPILVVPAGNDGGYEPNRSYLSPATTLAGREDFRRRFLKAGRVAADDPARGVSLYRSLLGQQPGFAEAHFRLGRLLAERGDPAGASRHFALARDLDGLPQRCPTPLLDACRAAGRREGCVLVDAPAVLRTLVPDGVLDDRLFHDAHHPNLRAYVALAQDVLDRLARRRAFGWPEGRPAPVIDPDECAAHFGVGPAQVATVCERTAVWYEADAFIRFDPSGRLEKARRLREAARRIEGGASPGTVGVPALEGWPGRDDPDRGPSDARAPSPVRGRPGEGLRP